MPPRFIKFHGFGNDYIVIESKDLAVAGISATAELGQFARRICNHHYGAGGDGIAVLVRQKFRAPTFMCAFSTLIAVKPRSQVTASMRVSLSVP